MTSEITIAFLSAGGTMGLPMARNLTRAGMHVRAWNRTREKAEQLQSPQASVWDTPAEAVSGADLVITMLADADAVLGAMEDLGGLPAMSDSALWLQMSTIGEAGTRRCAELASQRGVGFLDAPVLGTRAPAEDGTLIVLASGPEEFRQRAEPAFRGVGTKIIWVGEIGAGTRLKLALNSWVLAVVEAGAETIALTEHLGLEPRLIFEALDGGPLDLPYLRMKAKAISERDFDPSFRLSLAAKDARLVERSARERGLDLPIVRAIAERMEQGAMRHGDEDMSATYLTSAGEAA